MAWQNRSQSVDRGNHILAIYQDKEAEIEEALKFLLSGLKRNECVMLITDDKSKNEIRKKINDEWNANADDLEQNGVLILRSPREWYFLYGLPSAHQLNSLWISMLDYPRSRRKNGLRAFADMSAFFRYGFVKDLINYESTLEKKFNFPFTEICAYKSKDIDSLTQSQKNILKKHHDLVWE